MPLDEALQSPWTRKHDDPRFTLIPEAPRIVYPKNLAELIKLCKTPGQKLKAAGSHWALSQAAISDHTFIETHDPGEMHQAMGKTLTNVVPSCLNRDYIRYMAETAAASGRRWYLAHVEAGKRIYQLYSELDQLITLGNDDTLAGYLDRHHADPGFNGPWAFASLGGAGGQTIVGAFSTGTHGGDFDRRPIADSVMAIHLVADGGKHYWIEQDGAEEPPLTDDFKLTLELGQNEFGGPSNFEIIRNDETFRAVLVSAGRFGVIYSVVLKAVPQYSLYERRRLHVWQDIKHDIKDLDSKLYRDDALKPGGYVPATNVTDTQRFLQIAVSLAPHANFQRNLVGITKRWELALPQSPGGRTERVGAIVDAFDEMIQAPRFALAGRNHPYSPIPGKPNMGDSPGLLERACADASFLKGIIEATIEEIEAFVSSNGAAVGAGVAVVAAAGGAGLLALIPALLAILLILRELLDHFDDDTRFGEVMEQIKGKLLDASETDPAKKAAGIFAWQMIYYLAFQEQQKDRDYEAISYAVMDQKDYLNVSCEVNVDSIEVFFDAVDDRLIAFVDALIAFETAQEFIGKSFVGYASLRFMRETKALIGMQRYTVTCAVEVACLRDVRGSQELLDYAVTLARNPNINGILHWGQRNDWTRGEVERVYGGGPTNPGGSLGKWRKALRKITDDGRLSAFSSEFTRRTGLEP